MQSATAVAPILCDGEPVLYRFDRFLRVKADGRGVWVRLVPADPGRHPGAQPVEVSFGLHAGVYGTAEEVTRVFGELLAAAHARLAANPLTDPEHRQHRRLEEQYGGPVVLPDVEAR